VPELDKNPNVTILDGVSLRRFDTTSDGSKIATAHAINIKDKSPVVITARRFVVAMGGVETPRMLLLSADGAGGPHKEGLGNMGGQLGRGFSDHFNPWVTIDTGRQAGSRLGFETMICDHFRAHVDRREKPTFFMLASPAMDWFPVGVEAAAWSTSDNTLNLDDLRARIPNIATLATMTELEGKGRLELDPDTLDAFGSPVARVTLPLTDRDRMGSDQLKEFAPKLADAMNASNVSEVPPPELTMGYHPSGATAMARAPDEGVCNTNLRVFGLDNLYLASNSVFPHMGANPPTLTIAALALRLADHLEGGDGK
jgi:choline dehydrogenase-like flavoprotein